MSSNAPARTTGMFSTHKGQAVKRFMWLAFAAAFALMVVNGMVNGDKKDAAAEEDTRTTQQQVQADPRVEPAPVDPFNIKNKVKPVTAPETGTGENSLYQTAVATAGEGAKRYATYSHQQTPEQYVQLIRGLHPDSAKALTEAATLNWPEIESRQVTTVANIRSIQPKVVAFDSEKGTASVAVTVAQNVKDRDGEHNFSRSYLVELRLDTQGKWQILSFTDH